MESRVQKYTLISSVQFSHSVVSDSLWPHELQHARPPRPSPTPGVHSNSCPSSRWCHPAISSSVVPFSSCLQSKLMCIESVMPSNYLILCRPLLLRPSIPPSIRVFSNESILRMSWPKYWSFSFSISPSKEHPGLISFRIDWLDLLAVQGTLKSLLQHHSSKASILRCSAFFTVQLSHPSHIAEQWWEQWKQCQTLFLGAPKSLQMVTEAMKLKDAYSLEGKLRPT